MEFVHIAQFASMPIHAIVPMLHCRPFHVIIYLTYGWAYESQVAL